LRRSVTLVTVGAVPTVGALALERPVLVVAALGAERVAEPEAEGTFVDVVTREHRSFPASVGLAGDAVVARPKAPLAAEDDDVAKLGARDLASFGVGGPFGRTSAAYGDVAVSAFKTRLTDADDLAGAVIAASVEASVWSLTAQELNRA